MREDEPPGAVSVHYARQEYAMGYIQGRLASGAGPGDAAAFARFYVDRCEAAGEPVDVHRAFARWQEDRLIDVRSDRARVDAEVRFERAAEYATNYDE